MNPYLQDKSFHTIIQPVTGFGRQVRKGVYGQVKQVTGARVAVLIRANGQMCEMVLGNKLLYQAPERYLKPIELFFACFRCKDPIPQLEIAVPVNVSDQCAAVGL